MLSARSVIHAVSCRILGNDWYVFNYSGENAATLTHWLRKKARMAVVSMRVIAIAACLTLGTAYAQTSQHPPQRPNIETKKQAEGPTEPEQGTNTKQESSDSAPTVKPVVASSETGKKAEYQGEESGQTGTEFWPPFFGHRLKITDTMLVAVTLLLFIATLALYYATRKLVKGAEDTARSQLRAYIGINSAVLETELRQGRPMKVTVEIKNFGQTPAYKCVGSINCAALEFEGDVPMDLRGDLDPEYIGVIHGGAVLLKSRIKPDISMEEVTNIMSGKKALWLFGQFTYTTAFDMPQRTTKFRYFLAPSVGLARIGKDFGLSQHGNDAD
jgi:hypothetical protein